MFTEGKSVYTERFEDELGIYFDENTFPELPEAIAMGDVSELLQNAIIKLVREQQYGILYIPEGEYPIAKTVMVPKAVRLIGYGKKRPVFVLPETATGFESVGDVMHMPGWGEELDANYMIWFVSNYGPFEKAEATDANAGTFYSALTNIDFRIEGNHPSAVCIRAHFAQHAFISHCHFEMGTGLAAIYDVGNEMEDLSVEGGKYGLLCRMTSPGWPFAIFDCRLHGQECAAFMTSTTGFTGFRLHISDTKRAFECWNKEGWEKLYLEDCVFENISDCILASSESGNVGQQINVRNLACDNVADFAYRLDENKRLNFGSQFMVKYYSSGYHFSDTDEKAEFKEEFETSALNADEMNMLLLSNIPELGEMHSWVSVLSFGAKGDGESDDTKALQRALDSGENLYFPQGIYRITDTLEITNDCTMLGMHPATTQIVIWDDEEAFAGFGEPKPMLCIEKKTHIVMNGIGVDTASKNPRACGVLWAADETSYMNDVKFMGGHGMMYRDGRNPFETLYNPSRTADFFPERKWDYQYASLWIANGGGVFKDVWSCSPYAEAGIAITDTNTKCRMYAISLEHHVRHEIKINNVRDLKIYALQTEEEKAEGTECLPMEIVSSSDVEMINYYLFRVVSVDEPYDTGIRVWNSKDIHFLNLRNMAQMQYTFTTNLKDETTGFVAKSSDYARLDITGNRVNASRKKVCGYDVLAEGFSFAQGAAIDDEGSLYWCDKKKKTIYCYDAKQDTVYPIFDIHFTPAALAFDSCGNMLVAVDYSELKKKAQSNPFEDHDRSDFHPFFAWFYKRGEKAYSIDPKHPYTSMQALTKVGAEVISDLEKRPVIRCMELDYPGSFDQVMKRPLEAYYVAADGWTLLEGTKDIARSLALEKVQPGGNAIVTDDFLRKTYCYQVVEGGNYATGTLLANRGQYGACIDESGMCWVVEDRLYGFRDGAIAESRDIPWDAYAVRFVGKRVYLIGRSSIYCM